MRRAGGGLRVEEGVGRLSGFHLLLRLTQNSGTQAPGGRGRNRELRDGTPDIPSLADSVPRVQATDSSWAWEGSANSEGHSRSCQNPQEAPRGAAQLRAPDLGDPAESSLGEP